MRAFHKLQLPKNPPKPRTYKDAPLKWFEVPSRAAYKSPNSSSEEDGNYKFQGKKALKRYELMRKNAVKPNIPLVLAALKEARDLDTLLRMHGELVRAKDDQDISVANTLIEVLAKCGGIAESRRLFEQMRNRDIVSWNTMMSNCVSNGQPWESLELFGRVQEDGLLPNRVTYVVALGAVTLLAENVEGTQRDGYLKRGEDIHARLKKFHYDADVAVASALVSMYARCGSISRAIEIFDRMEHHDVASWAAVVLGYAESGYHDLALESFSRMKEEGFIPNAQAFVGALTACFGLDIGKSLHSEIQRVRVKTDVKLDNALVNMYARCGSMVDARRIFEKMPHRDALTWTGVVTGYVECDEPEQALQMFARMKEEGVKPGSRAYAAAFRACGELAAKGKLPLSKPLVLRQASAIHSELEPSSLSNVSVMNVLIDAYIKCGSLQDAECVFKSLFTRDKVSWGLMIMGYMENGQYYDALGLFRLMQQEGFEPDCDAFVAAVTACIRLVYLDGGKRIYQHICEAGLDNDPLIASLVKKIQHN